MKMELNVECDVVWMGSLDIVDKMIRLCSAVCKWFSTFSE
jgi:hypothetical protein